MRPPRPLYQRRAERGAAMTELALVAPLLVVLILFSLFLSEEVNFRMKLQEASRYLAWEMTAHPLSDYSPDDKKTKTDPDKAYSLASKHVLEEGLERYKDLDSIEPSAGPNFIATFDPLAATMVNDAVPLVDSSMHLDNTRSDAEFATPYSAMSAGENAVLKDFGFDLRGRISVTVTSAMHNHILPKHYLETGGGGWYSTPVSGAANLDDLHMKNTFTLVADDWHLTDGAEAVMTKGRAGRHLSRDDPGANSGLYRQVNRMTFYGGDFEFGWRGRMLGTFTNELNPKTNGTYVVSHAYWPRDNPDAPQRGCNLEANRTSYSGMNNLDYETSGAGANDDAYPGVDGVRDTTSNLPELRCFDTSPFRDAKLYDDNAGGGGSQYVEIFNHRGVYFMGCKNDQAEDTTHASDSSTGDLHTDLRSCE